jgi:hypothetical protein
MGASANDRHRLHVRLEQLLGAEDAATLMEHLPPSPWDDLATKADLRMVRDEMRGLRDDLRADMGRLEDRLKEHVDLRVKASVGDSTRLLFFSLLTSQATLVGAVIAAVKLG